jgi:AcrR family transcriptional regulator
MRHFAEAGYQGARIEAMAEELNIAKGSIFQHFHSKARLFFEAYTRAVSSLPAWLDAPSEVLDGGFFATVRYWLDRTEHLVKEDWIPYRVALIGNYGTDLALKRDINRFLVSEDPYGTLEFVEWGPEPRGGPCRRGPRAHGLDAGLAVRLAPRRPGDRGARPRSVPPVAGPAQSPADPPGSVRRGPAASDRHTTRVPARARVCRTGPQPKVGRSQLPPRRRMASSASSSRTTRRR